MTSNNVVLMSMRRHIDVDTMLFEVMCLLERPCRITSKFVRTDARELVLCFSCFLKHTMYAIHHGDLLLLLSLAITVWSGLALCLPVVSADNF